MYISRHNAMQIVKEMSGIIHQHINMMDAKGYIIASTDSERIGKFHGSAYKIITQGLNQMVVENDIEYAGAKKGINLPIMLQNEIVGVIGITGERSEVEKYGQIIKRMTEILLVDIYMKEQQSLDEKIRNRYLDEWIFSENFQISKKFVNRGKALGIDISIPRRVIIFSIYKKNANDSVTEDQLLIDHVEKFVRQIISSEENNIFFRSGQKLIALVKSRANGEIKYLSQNIQEQTREKYDVLLCAGVDSERSGNVHQAYLQAEKALKTTYLIGKGSVKFYDDISVEIFLDEISKTSKEEYIKRIFSNFEPEEIMSSVKLLKIFYDSNGSITTAAQKLFIHKNTLQYKLKKLYSETNLDPRNMPDAALFYLAILFYEDLHFSIFGR